MSDVGVFCKEAKGSLKGVEDTVGDVKAKVLGDVVPGVV
jgi:hypothetical protein